MKLSHLRLIQHKLTAAKSIFQNIYKRFAQERFMPSVFDEDRFQSCAILASRSSDASSTPLFASGWRSATGSQ
jgi:hypothetical protein